MLGLAFACGALCGAALLWAWQQAQARPPPQTEVPAHPRPPEPTLPQPTATAPRVGLEVRGLAPLLRRTLEEHSKREAERQRDLTRLDSSTNELKRARRALGRITQRSTTPAPHSNATVALSDHLSDLLAHGQRESNMAKDVAEGYLQLAHAWPEAHRYVGSIEEKLQSVTTKTKEVTEAVEQAIRISEVGYKSLHTTIDQVEEARKAILQAGRQMENLMNQLSGVENVVKIIELVAQQTNLLSLNAAILAAQSSHSEAFAVLATEIKTLAERTRASTHDISKQIREMVNLNSVVEDSIHRSSDAVGAAYNSALGAGDALNELRDQSMRMGRATRTATKLLQAAPEGRKQLETRPDVTAPTQMISEAAALQEAMHAWRIEFDRLTISQQNAQHAERDEMVSQLRQEAQLLEEGVRALETLAAGAGMSTEDSAFMELASQLERLLEQQQEE